MPRNSLARRIPVPDQAVPAGTDYASAFRAEPPATRLGTAEPDTAEAWARGVFEGQPQLVRMLLRFGWVALLRLRLGPATSTDQIAGWTIATDTPITMRLTARSPLLDASNRVEVDDFGVVWLTEVNFTGRLGRILWGLAAPIHHATMPVFLRRTARAISSR